MDFIVRNARLSGRIAEGPLDIGVEKGRIVAIERNLRADAESYDAKGRLACPGLIETHIHLDKSRIIDRCTPQEHATLSPVTSVAPVKKNMTVEDVHARAAKTLEQCIVHGATRMRTQVEVDPGIGMRGFDGVQALIGEYKWAIDIEICVFPQEGLISYPGSPSAEHMDIHLVRELTDKYKRGGRVVVGHMAKLSLLPPDRLAAMAKSLAGSGIAVTVLPATDLFLMGRDQDHSVRRGVADANVLSAHGVTCSLSTNNVLNPATPYGDCSLIRMANLYANVLHVDRPAHLSECFDMLTHSSARLLNLKDYGFVVGNPADVVVIDAQTPEQAVAEISQPVAAFKNGRQTVEWNLPKLRRPH